MTEEIETLGVAVIGCGLIGRRRAEVAAAHPDTRLVAVADLVAEAAEEVADAHGAQAFTDWHAALAAPGVDIVCVATLNAALAEISQAALAAGCHVLVEKPMGRNLEEAQAMCAAAEAAGRRLKIGFNHRYHPALTEAHKRVGDGVIGDIVHIRARYGHGGRPGYEKEWRGSRELAGGGELTDQGVHVIDLIHWFMGSAPATAYGCLQTAVWPLGDLEDNGFALLRWDDGRIANFHTAWIQWKNLFSFEVFGTLGSLVIDGLGRSYGTETLTQALRKPEGGVPDMETVTYDGPDDSWALEWADFLDGIHSGRPVWGDADEGVGVMRTLKAIYASAKTDSPARLEDQG